MGVVALTGCHEYGLGVCTVMPLHSSSLRMDTIRANKVQNSCSTLESKAFHFDLLPPVAPQEELGNEIGTRGYPCVCLAPWYSRAQHPHQQEQSSNNGGTCFRNLGLCTGFVIGVLLSYGFRTRVS